MKKLIFITLCALVAGCDQPYYATTDVCIVQYRDGTTEKIPCRFTMTDGPMFGPDTTLVILDNGSQRNISLSDVKSWSHIRGCK